MLPLLRSKARIGLPKMCRYVFGYEISDEFVRAIKMLIISKLCLESGRGGVGSPGGVTLFRFSFINLLKLRESWRKLLINICIKSTCYQFVT